MDIPVGDEILSSYIGTNVDMALVNPPRPSEKYIYFFFFGPFFLGTQ